NNVRTANGSKQHTNPDRLNPTGSEYRYIWRKLYPNRAGQGQTVNTMGIVQVQGTISKQEAGTTELNNITQTDKIEVEDTQVTTRNWNTKGSEQNTQPK
ncbi:32854_t:CDS:2, partial [Gigaspora margarita]